ncbi:MAG: FAD-dependent oxidoreductase [Verrucomicrobiota bacterium]
MKHLLLTLIHCAILSVSYAEPVAASLRDIPVLYETDIVVAGGSSAAVAAACAAAQHGAQVVLIAPRPYLGDDLCGQQHLWLAEGELPESELARSLFPDGRVTTPFAVKNALDQALLKRGVRYLTGCYATDLLVDGQGRASGVVMVNRSGSQAIKAKVVIDGTRQALLARQVGAQFRPFTPGEQAFQFTVVGGELQSGPGLLGRKLDIAFKNPNSGRNTNGYPVYEYAAQIPISDSSYASFAHAEQTLRNLVSGVGMLDCSEYALNFPADTLIGERRVESDWPGAARCEVGVFRPKGSSRLYVLSEYADVCAKARPGMMRPLAFLAVGELVGNAAALESKPLTIPAEVRLPGEPAQTGSTSTIGEPRNVMMPTGKTGVIQVGTRVLPVLGDYDVVVVGGGTAGAPAGIGAARCGAKTLVIEYLDELGGVGTAGLIGSYWYGNRNGFTKEIEAATSGEKRWSLARKAGWNVIQKSEWLRRELLKSNADIWFNSFGCGALLENGKVTGVVVVTPFGRGVVRAKTVIDATGNADIADCAGAETQFGVAAGGMLSVQLAGYPHRNLGDNGNNTCYAMVDDTSVWDIWHLMTWARTQRDKAAPYDMGQLLDSRERRRIVADYMLTTPDILNHRSFPDTISHHKSNFDAAAFPTSPMLLVKDMKGPAYEVDLPYRSLLPKGLDGILVTGLGAGAERDAMTLIRMQSDLQNQGYAAGVAAATASANGGQTRAIDIKKLQQQLVAQGILDERVLTNKDSYPMNQAAIEKAVADVSGMSREIKQTRTITDPFIFSLAVIMAHPDSSRPHLQQAHHASTAAEKKLTYAIILGILGDKTGAPTLIASLENAKGWDKGFGLTSHRESDNTFSELDRQIIALGFSGAPEGLTAIVAKLKLLKPDSELSHYIAIAMALRHYDHPKNATEPLARLLNAPGFTGHVMTNAIELPAGKVVKRDLATTLPDTSLNAAFKELLIAGMLVHCGDQASMGRKILEQYRGGIGGHFARYAQYVLQTADDRTKRQ